MKQLALGGVLLGALPTGFVNSMYVFSIILQLRMKSPHIEFYIVICQLKSIIPDQVIEVESLGIYLQYNWRI